MGFIGFFEGVTLVNVYKNSQNVGVPHLTKKVPLYCKTLAILITDSYTFKGFVVVHCVLSEI